MSTDRVTVGTYVSVPDNEDIGPVQNGQYEEQAETPEEIQHRPDKVSVNEWGCTQQFI